MRSDGERALGGLLAASHLATMEDLPALVAEHAATMGFSGTLIYVVDLQQQTLVPLPGQRDAAGRPPERLGVDTTLPGRAFQTVSLVYAMPGPGGGRRRLWMPLLDGTERVGVLGTDVPDEDPELAEWRAAQLAALIAVLVVSKRPHSDSYSRLVRSRPMTLSAEVMWSLLPPGTFASEGVVVSAAMEPAYEVGGDAYDYAIDGDVLHVSLFDAMGHDTAAGLTASVAMAASRHDRRRGTGLPEVSEAVDAAIRAQFVGRYATGLLASLDLRTGLLRWVNRGHHPPLVIRGGRRVATLETVPVPDPPMGFGLGVSRGLLRYQLEPGDRLLFYTDGIVEARSPDGEVFGLERFADFVVRHEADGVSAPETLRRLIQAILRHQGDRLQDDATVMTVEWYGERHRLLTLP
ncbi:PP2C family protein-serine/threonine phosphatase [Nonomuraea wenchangensis]|uniref:Stage II sporulation protein E (SpoIIE) n=1 Tax=Nonomuraea wenchangensis TaxID=568860 RepID=A0A1I0KXH6_9ACTN|nr:PP2C family protein-serine/threonine phosphatase [Nonomuraea wenchangensis]SEU30796.1 Stage II sporulation protein E (SpoIIE) [Nonomuraea wenchangensis]